MPIRSVRARTILVMLAIGMALFTKGRAAAADQEIVTDDLQRSLRLDTYKVVADSGPGRGENIYFYKCWMCYNQYAKTGPYLKELYKHSQLMSGDPVTDENVTAKIKEGGPGMPSD